MPLVNHEEIENSPKLKAYYENKRLFYLNIFWLIGGNTAAVFGQNTAQTLMPLHMAEINLTAQNISTIMAVSSWIGVPLILYISYLTDHWQGKMGRRRPFLLLQLPFTFIGLFFFGYTGGIFSCLFFYGMFYIFNSIKYTSYPFLINDVSKQKYWGRINAFHVFFSYVGVWLGLFFLMPLTDKIGAKPVFMFAALLMFLGELATLVFIKEPPIRSQIPPQYNPFPVILKTIKFGISDRRRIAVCLAFAMTTALGVSFYYIPLQAKVNLQLSEGDVARKILQYGPIATVIWSFCSGFVIDKFGPVKAMFTGYIFAVAAMLIGISPLRTSDIIENITALEIAPAYLLAAAYLLYMTANTFIYMGAQIFMMSSVRRENMAQFCALAGSVNLLGQSFLMMASGWLITNVFNENYGIVFVLSLAVVSLGIPLWFFIDRKAKKITTKT